MDHFIDTHRLNFNLQTFQFEKFFKTNRWRRLLESGPESRAFVFLFKKIASLYSLASKTTIIDFTKSIETKENRIN